MKTLKKQSVDTSGKVCTEYVRAKESDIVVKMKDGWKFCGKIEWKTATQGYGKKKVVKAEVTNKAR